MAIYFVDYENVHEGGLKGMEQLVKEDTLCLLYSNSAQSLTIDTMSALTVSSVKIIYFKCQKVGKNYLDFQLATICGMMAGSQSDTDFVIVSGDKGFNSLVDFWNEQEYLGKRFTCRLQASVGTEKAAEKMAEPSGEGKASGDKKNRTKQKPGTKHQAAKPSEVKQPEAKPSEGKLPEIKQPEIKQPEAKPSEGKQPEVKPSEGKQPEAKPSEIKQPEVRPSEAGQQEHQNQEQKMTGTAVPGTVNPGMLQKEGVENIPDSVKKKVRQAVKNLNLKPSEYIVIYRSFLKSASESDLKNRLMRRMGKELGTKTYEAVLNIYQSMLQHGN